MATIGGEFSGSHAIKASAALAGRGDIVVHGKGGLLRGGYRNRPINS